MPQSWVAFDTKWENGTEPWLAFYVQLWDKENEGIYLEQIALEISRLEEYGGGFCWGAGGASMESSTLERQPDGSWIQTSNNLRDGEPDRIITYQFLTLDLYQYYFPKKFDIDFRSTEDLQAYMVKYNAEEFGIK